MNILTLAPALAVCLSSVGNSPEQDFIEILRADVRAERVAVLTDAMELEEDDGERFWPIYREYDLELSKLGDRRLSIMKHYAENHDTLGNEEVKKIARDWFKLQEDHLKLKKKYFDRIEKELSTTIAARFLQVEHQIGLLMELGLVEETPLVNPVRKR